MPDTTLPIPALRFDATGALVILPSAISSAHDFDYLVGTWKLRNRKLKSRLPHSTEWIPFESRVEMHQILNGRNIIVVFRWDVRNPNLPIWSQAFSTDDGKTWEWNSINVSERVR